MKNVLMIASLYGSKRVVGLAKYLLEFGWSPTIITPPVSWQPTLITDPSRKLPDLPFKTVETAYTDPVELLCRLFGARTVEGARSKIKTMFHATRDQSWVDRIFHLAGGVINYPDAYHGWRKFALAACKQHILEDNIEAVISICPVTAHIVASRLKQEYKMKWICDLPDLWSQNHVYAYGSFRRMLDRKLELRTLSKADILTTSSEPRTVRQRQLHPDKRVETVVLGYDAQEYDAVDIPLAKKFRITYTGSVYDSRRQSTGLLLVALDSLIRLGKIDREDCEIHYYGSQLSCIEETVQSLGLQDVAHLYGVVSHNDVARIQKVAQMLLIIDLDDPDELGAMPGKIFEYLGARRPILVTGGVKGNVVDKLVQETRSGYHATDVGEAEQILLRCYQEWKETGRVEYHGVRNERYTQREMARKYAGLLDG